MIAKAAMKTAGIVWRRRSRQGYYGSARLDARASVPPLTRPPPPGSLPLGFHRGNLSLRDLENTTEMHGSWHSQWSTGLNECSIAVVPKSC
jgi:hypothetical protein